MIAFLLLTLIHGCGYELTRTLFDRYILQNANPDPLTAPRIGGDLFFGASMALFFLLIARKRLIEAARKRLP